MATASASGRSALQVGPSGFDAEKLSRDLEERLSRDGRGEIIIIGTNATKEVVRAVLALESVLHDRNGAGGMPRARLALVPTLDVPQVEGRFSIGLTIRPTHHLPVQARGEMIMARTSNIGRVAGGIAQRVREDGSASARGAGTVALKQTLKAIAIARGYLADRNELGEHDLAALSHLKGSSASQIGLPMECTFTIFRLARDIEPS